MPEFKISVVIAAFHGEKYIGDQLKSLFSQTRPPDEILIGDDSDDDATFQAVEAVKNQYTGKLRYIRNPQRLGVVRNFVLLAQKAKEDLIFFCDQDDIWLPNKIETLASVLERDPTCEVAVCNSEMVDSELNSLHETLLDGITDFHKKMYEINAGRGFFPLLNQSIGFSGHNMAMRRSFLNILIQIPLEYKAHDLWLEQSAGFLGVLRYVDKVLTLYRMHGKNTSNPCLQKVKQNLLHRFREIWTTSWDVFYFADLLRGFVRFAKRNYPENPNIELLTAYCSYFNWRAGLLKMSYSRRWLKIFVHPWRQLEHFRYGFGARSLIRDLIVKPEDHDKETAP